MSAQDLSFSELLDATQPWTEDPAAAFLAANGASASYMGQFTRLRALLLAGAASGDSALAQLTDELGLVDSDHDEVVRFIIAYFAAFAHDDDEAIAATAARLCALVIPEGATLVGKSYADESGSGVHRASRLTPEIRAELATCPLPGSRTIADKVDRLQALAAELGALLERRRALTGDATGPTGMELLNTRRALIALVEHVLQSFRMLRDDLEEAARAQVDALDASWRAAVSEATARAAARRARAEKKPDPTDPAAA